MGAQRASEQEPINLDAHRGSRWSMHIRDGLVEGKHRKAMGDAIWLYLYLHKNCAQKTGAVKFYRHIDAAGALGVDERTIRRYMQALIEGGYVLSTRRHNHFSLQITRYEWQEGRTTDRTESVVLPPGDRTETPVTSPQTAGVTGQKVSSDRTESAVSIQYTTSFNKDAVEIGSGGPVVCADAPPAPTDEQATESPSSTVSSLKPEGTPPHSAPPPMPAGETTDKKEKKQTAARTGADLLAEQLQQALGYERLSDKTRQRWTRIFRATLKDVPPDKRALFPAWFVSSGYWGRHNPQLLSDARLEAECLAWIDVGMPATKQASPTQKQKPRAAGLSSVPSAPDLENPAVAAVEDRIKAYRAAKHAADQGPRA